MEFEKIKAHIHNWNHLVKDKQNNIELILKYLKSGFCFVVNREDYNQWNAMETQPEFIHVYFSINPDNNALEFFLVDSVNDANTSFDDGTIIGPKAFTYGLTTPPLSIGSIEKSDALQRAFNWQLYPIIWLNNANDEFFQLIRIPFQDYQKLFDDPIQHNQLINFIGLKQKKAASNWDEQDWEIEFIVSDYNLQTAIQPVHFEDVSRPVPPFPPAQGSMHNFQLFLLANHFFDVSLE